MYKSEVGQAPAGTEARRYSGCHETGQNSQECTAGYK